MKIHFFYISILLWLSACQTPEKNTDGKTFEIPATYSSVFEWPNGLQVSEIIYLESTDSSLVSDIASLYRDSLGNIYIWDIEQHKVFVFDKQGAVLRILQKKGEGLHGYTEIKDVQIDFDKGLLYILDYNRIKSYDLQNFAHAGTLDAPPLEKLHFPFNFVLLGDSQYFWTDNPTSPQVNFSNLHKAPFKHLSRVQAGKVQSFIPHLYGSLNEARRFTPSHRAGEYNITPLPGSDALYAINKDSVYLKYRFPFAQHDTPEEVHRNMFELRNRYTQNQYYKCLLPFFETSQHLYFSFIGEEGKKYELLFDKVAQKFLTVGKSKLPTPIIIASDAKYFYAYYDAEFIRYFLQEKGDAFRQSPIFRDLDEKRIAQDGNPIIFKFSLP